MGHSGGTDDGEPPTWRRSSRCEPSGDCVEVLFGGHSRTGVRDSKNAGAATLELSASAWSQFVGRLTGQW
ncbi:DUF397 domain-containing protein [Actinokineospora pegani]|uniref:DUF397 domain-containing protein n=1 Tax=Actinokineospora pegani TaxID=2654637 RepID=UPI0012EAD0F1|nr:DUF397 domain-containing protein [Actinokineospora pegani]